MQHVEHGVAHCVFHQFEHVARAETDLAKGVHEALDFTSKGAARWRYLLNVGHDVNAI